MTALPPYLKLSEILEACVSPHVSASRVKTDLRNAGLLKRINERGHHRVESQALEARLRGYYDLVWALFERRARTAHGRETYIGARQAGINQNRSE